MNPFSNDSERLEFALHALRTISGMLKESQSSDPVTVKAVADAAIGIASETIRTLENSQKEPAADINDLLLQLHEH